MDGNINGFFWLICFEYMCLVREKGENVDYYKSMRYLELLEKLFEFADA